MSVSESDIAARLQLGALGLWITSRSNRDLNHHHYCDLTMKRTIKNQLFYKTDEGILPTSSVLNLNASTQIASSAMLCTIRLCIVIPSGLNYKFRIVSLDYFKIWYTPQKHEAKTNGNI